MTPLFSELTVVGASGGSFLQALWTDPRRAGPRLMAVDEALLHEVPGPALHLYTWEQPWVSLGYFEEAAPPHTDLPTVRRWTGGGVVCHRPFMELTYGLSVPRSHPFYAVSPVESYRRIHRAVHAALTACGVPCALYEGGPATPGGACFEKPMPGDILATGTGEKLAGAGQRRHRLGLLHQGSIQLAQDVPAALPEQLVACLTERAKREPTIDEAVLARSASLAADRYEKDDWLHRAGGRRPQHLLGF